MHGVPLALHAADIRKELFGTSHPSYAHALSVLASYYQAIGCSLDACKILEKCIEICEGAFRRNHANLVPNLMSYGAALRYTSNLAEPRAVYDGSTGE